MSALRTIRSSSRGYCSRSAEGRGICALMIRAIEREGSAELPVSAERELERLTVDVIHRDEVARFVLPDLVDRHHVRMMDARRDPRFAEEHLDERWLFGQVLVDHFERSETLE